VVPLALVVAKTVSATATQNGTTHLIRCRMPPSP
jgi:hypothetical protein